VFHIIRMGKVEEIRIQQFLLGVAENFAKRRIDHPDAPVEADQRHARRRIIENGTEGFRALPQRLLRPFPIIDVFYETLEVERAAGIVRYGADVKQPPKRASIPAAEKVFERGLVRVFGMLADDFSAPLRIRIKIGGDIPDRCGHILRRIVSEQPGKSRINADDFSVECGLENRQHGVLEQFAVAPLILPQGDLLLFAVGDIVIIEQ
jgi:hypothetical protein